ncbi:hypothetical protein QTP88_005464 [Uroleucon formosanum]
MGWGEGRVNGWPSDGRAHAYKLRAHVAAAGTATQGPSAAAHTRPASTRTHVQRGVVVIGWFRRRYKNRTYVGYRSRVVAHRHGRRCRCTTHTVVAVVVVAIAVAVVRKSQREPINITSRTYKDIIALQSISSHSFRWIPENPADR